MVWTDDRIAGELETNNGVHPRLDGLVSVLDGENQRLFGSLRPETCGVSALARGVAILDGTGQCWACTGRYDWSCGLAVAVGLALEVVGRQLEVGGSSS